MYNPIRATLAALTLAALATAQSGAARPEPVDFRTPDGSRFVLLPRPKMETVEWAIATPADAALDLPGLEGLAVVAAKTSLFGTWQIGSLDAEKEQAAHRRLDAAWREMFATKMSPAAQAELKAAQDEVAALGDPAVFRRVLATIPVDRPEVRHVGTAAVLSLTTVPEALPQLCDLLVQRREQQALRELPKVWAEELVARQRAFDADPRSLLYAEVVAMALPGHPALRNFERPSAMPPQRSQAQVAWQRSQHPARTVHVLLGGFDPTTVRNLLESKFDSTALPLEPLPEAPLVRPIASERRSTVPGCKAAATLFAWQLPAGTDATTATAMARWLAGPQGRIADELRKRGLGDREVRVRAPWPAALGLAGLLLVEIGGPQDGKERADTLRDAVMATVAEAAAEGPGSAESERIDRDMARAAATVAAEPRWLARETAELALRRPGQTPKAMPTPVRGSDVRDLAAAVFGGKAVIVEGVR